jgi:hypothetical protein
MPTTKDWSLIAGMLLARGIWAGVSTADAQDAENAHRQYCEMVAQWDKDAAQDVAPEQRRGWPPYDGRKQCKTEE